LPVLSNGIIGITKEARDRKAGDCYRVLES